jgi:anti-anti-sigma factor
MRLADVCFSGDEHTVIARLSGEVDLSNAAQLRSALVEATPNHCHALILDLSEVDYLDSAGIQVIYQMREQLRGRGQTLRMVIPSSSAASDALRLASVSRFVETVETLDEALAQID